MGPQVWLNEVPSCTCHLLSPRSCSWGSHQGWRLHPKGSPPSSHCPLGWAHGCRLGSAGLTKTQALLQSSAPQTSMSKLHLGQGAETSSSCFLAMLFPFAVHTGEPLTGKLRLLCPLLHPRRNERTGTARQKAAKAKYT